ncbi:cytochrome P450 [Actinosynnema sp. ALI-1.44]|uniref:cytochrome P450 n=1 Tax=Actinosynnema sp. ALI-1.44 TaxID=1933779 RepID=UPI00097BCF58|nr:cytochrome P450 [Actinosynnema sp. ALI-1.44]
MRDFPFPAGPMGTLPVEYDTMGKIGLPVVSLPDGMEIRLAVRYSDVAAVLTDERFSRALAADLPGTGFGRNQRTGLLDLDPPDHAVLRDPLDRALAADRVERWLPSLRSLVHEQVTAFAAGDRPADLVRGFAAPVASRSICALVGLGVAAAADVATNIDEMLASGSAEARSTLRKAVEDLVTRRRAEPADDIATSLLELSDDDAATVLFGLLISGYVGNRNALARHVFALLAAPGADGVLPSLATRPERVGRVVDELLRYYPSGNDGLLRVAREPVWLSGVLLEPGTVVMPVIAAASHDPEVFDRPEVFDPDREPNTHVSLGRGTHRCPGDHLVRALFGIVLTELTTALPRLRLAIPASEVRHTDDLLPLGIVDLPVTW